MATTRRDPRPLHPPNVRVLALDGGGAKGFYTLGVLDELEALLGGEPLASQFDLIFGTSTGAIIAALLGLGHSVDDIHTLYKTHVPTVMGMKSRRSRTRALHSLAATVFGERDFGDIKTGVGIVAAKWDMHTPMIFKSDPAQAHGMKPRFVPGFGVKLRDAVRASCSAYPFFERTIVTTSREDVVELIDGGYCANNPTLYAIADAAEALKAPRASIRVVSVGVGVYPEPDRGVAARVARQLWPIQLLQKTLEINTQSMDQLRRVLFADVPTVRIDETFTQPELATDLLESDLRKLNLLRRCGRQSFAHREREIRDLFA